MDYSFAEGNLVIGKMSYGYISTTSYFRFNGYIDDFRIYPVALNDTDIKRLYEVKTKVDKEGNIFSGNFIEDENLEKNNVDKKYNVNSMMLIEDNTEFNLVSSINQIEYTPSKDGTNQCIGGYRVLFPDGKVNTGDKFRIELDVEYSGFDTSSTAGKFDMYFQGVWWKNDGSNYWHGNNTFSTPLNSELRPRDAVLSSDSGIYHYNILCTVPSSLSNDSEPDAIGVNVGLRTDYSNGVGHVKIFNLKIIPEKYDIDGDVHTKVNNNYIITKEFNEI